MYVSNINEERRQNGAVCTIDSCSRARSLFPKENLPRRLWLLAWNTTPGYKFVFTR